MPHHIPVPGQDFVTFCVTFSAPPLLALAGKGTVQLAGDRFCLQCCQ